MIPTEDYDANAVRKQRLLDHIDRLKITEGLESYRAIERVYEGVSASYLSQVACGQRKFTAKIASKYETYFKLPQGYFSQQEPPPYQPYINLVRWGYGLTYISKGDKSLIIGRFPNIIERDNVFAIKVAGGLLAPLAKHGDVLFVDYYVNAAALEENDIALFEQDNTFIFKKLVINPSGEKAYIDIFNPLAGAGDQASFIGKITAKFENF